MSERRCPNCKETVAAGHKFCPYCGTSLEKTPKANVEEFVETIELGESSETSGKTNAKDSNSSKTVNAGGTSAAEHIETDVAKAVKPKRKINWKKIITAFGIVIAVLILAGILISFLTPPTEGSIAGDFDRGTRQEYMVNDLKCFFPANWEVSQYDEDEYDGEWLVCEKRNDDGVLIAQVKVAHERDSESIYDVILPGDRKSLEVQGCSADMSEYDDDDDSSETVHTKEYAIDADGTVFSVEMSALEHIYDEEQFDEIFNAIDFEGYINAHCIVDNCTNDKAENSDYCDEHMCNKFGCREGGTEKADSGLTYCKKHVNICKVKDCNKEKLKGFDFCSAHKCEIQKCNKKKIGKHYCAKHAKTICRMEGCNRERAEDSKYCSKHQSHEYETGISFNQLARNPDKYEGEKVKFSGKVLQVMEGDYMVSIRLGVNGSYDNVIYGTYFPSLVSSRVLEDDYITVYGTSEGLYTYESTMGASITIPSLSIEKIEQ